MKEYQVKFDNGLDLSRAEPLSDFSFPWKEEECPETLFRAVWNGHVLSFRFDVEDRDLVLAQSEDAGQGALGSDRVELFFASSVDLKKPYYGAEMDPSGRVYDFRATYHRNFDPGWSFSTLVFSGRTHSEGYRVAGQIRIRELEELDLLKGGKLTVGVYRAEFSHQGDGSIAENWISWMDPKTETPDFHVPSSFGSFQLLEDL